MAQDIAVCRSCLNRKDSPGHGKPLQIEHGRSQLGLTDNWHWFSMNRGRSISLSFPPFTPWVKKIVLVCAGVYLLQVILGVVAPTAEHYLVAYFGLRGADVMHGLVW